MKLKSYFSDSVESALGQARKELGPDAMLVYSRQSTPEAHHLGPYEVVFSVAATDGATSPAPQNPDPAPTAQEEAGRTRGDSFGELAREMDGLRRQVSRLTDVLLGAGAPVETAGLDGAIAPLRALAAELRTAGLDAEIVTEILARMSPSQGAAAPEGAAEMAGDWKDLARRTLTGMFSVSSGIGARENGARVMTLVGPPGAGKTTALVKLAAAYGMRTQRPAQLISADMYRVGAAEQLRSFASILGVGFQAVESTFALRQAVEEHRHKDLVLIDTPGHTPADIAASTELADFLRDATDIEVQLTLPASMKRADIRRVCRQFEVFRPDKYLLTKLDETTSPGTVVNEVIRTGKPISYFSTGQRIPEDLREATAERLLDLILPMESTESPAWSIDERPVTGATLTTAPRADRAAAA